MTDVLESLPDRPVQSSTVNDLEDHPDILQSVPVRGFYTPNGPEAHQILVNIRGERILGLNFDGESWNVVYDSDQDGFPEDPQEQLRPVHERLEQYAPEIPNPNRFQNTPPYFESDWVDGGETP